MLANLIDKVLLLDAALTGVPELLRQYFLQSFDLLRVQVHCFEVNDFLWERDGRGEKDELLSSHSDDPCRGRLMRPEHKVTQVPGNIPYCRSQICESFFLSWAQTLLVGRLMNCEWTHHRRDDVRGKWILFSTEMQMWTTQAIPESKGRTGDQAVL